MNSKLGIKRTAIAAAFLAASAASGSAFAIVEDETLTGNPNNTIATAQGLAITGGTVEVMGFMAGDVDFYRFEGFEGNLVTIDIDFGMKKPGERSVDTILAIFGWDATKPGWKKLDWNDDAEVPHDDPGSSVVPYWDARIDNFRLPATGAYVVGVSSYLRYFKDYCCDLTSTALSGLSNGSYTLLISGVKLPVMQISIEIKPGTIGDSAPINPKSKGNIPVALLSNPNFNALEVDEQSLRFGPEGTESSWIRCNKGTFVDADDKLDLVCHFDTQAAGFQPTDSRGMVKGSLKDGRRFEGRGHLKVVPVKRGQ